MSWKEEWEAAKKKARGEMDTNAERSSQDVPVSVPYGGHTNEPALSRGGWQEEWEAAKKKAREARTQVALSSTDTSSDIPNVSDLKRTLIYSSPTRANEILEQHKPQLSKTQYNELAKVSGAFVKNAPKEEATPNGFYERPQPSERLLTLQNLRNAQGTTAEREYGAVKQAQGEMRDLIVKQPDASDRFARRGSDGTYADTVLGMHANKGYQTKHSTFEQRADAMGKVAQAVGEFVPTAKSLAEYDDAYQKEAAAYEKQLADWKSTIRDKDTIQAELDYVQNGSRDENGRGGVLLGEEEKQKKIQLLEEELFWRDYFDHETEYTQYAERYDSGEIPLAQLHGKVADANARIVEIEQEIRSLEKWEMPEGSDATTNLEAREVYETKVASKLAALREELEKTKAQVESENREYNYYWSRILQDMQEDGANASSYNAHAEELLGKRDGGLWDVYRAVSAQMQGDTTGFALTASKYGIGHMNEKECRVFLYCCNSGNYEAAQAWLEDLQPTLTARKGAAAGEAIDFPVLREAIVLASSALAGFKNLGYGVASLFADVDAPETSAGEHMVGYLQEKHKGSIAGYTTAAAASIGNQVPSFMAYAVNPTLGKAATFFTTRGSAYIDAKRNGASHEEAWVYSSYVGAAETGLEAVLGGLGGRAKGIIPDMLSEWLSGAGKRRLSMARRLVKDYAVHTISELTEENLQNYLEPMFQMFAGMKDHYEAPGWEDFVETSIVTVLSSTVFYASNLPAKTRQLKFNETARTWAQKAVKTAPKDSELYLEGSRILEKLKNGEHVIPSDMVEVFSRVGQNMERMANDPNRQRINTVQAQNPDATVLRSPTVQKYIDTGTVTLPNAQKASSILDEIVSGRKTEVTNNEIDSLMLTSHAGAKVASEVLGIEIPQIREKSKARANFRAALQQYVENRAQNSNASSIQQEMQVTETIPASQEVAENRNIAPDNAVHDSAPVQEPVSDTPPSQNSMQNTPVEEVYDSPDMDNFNAETVPTEEIDPRKMGYMDFVREYKKTHKSAGTNELQIAFDKYRNEPPVGLLRNEYSTQVDASVADAVDELGKLFGLDIRFDDLGNDNGYYLVGTNKVVIDINPLKRGTVNPFLFTASHELGHAIRDRLGADAWSAFETYAIAAMGGESSVKDKQKQSSVYRDVADAREDVACDFLGKLLSDKSTLDAFCASVRNGAFNAEHAKGIAGLIRRIVQKIRNSKQFSAAIEKQFGENIDAAKKAADAILQAAESAVKAKENTAGDGSVVRKSEKDYPIDADIASIVQDALQNSNSQMNDVGEISSAENKAINRFANTREEFRGNYHGGHHLVSSDAISHACTEHGSVMREALRAQLPITERDISRTLSAIKNKKARVHSPSFTREGRASILQSIEVNGYTLYAEEIVDGKSKNSPKNLIGHTMYKAPTLPTAAVPATSAGTLPKRQSEVLYETIVAQNGKKSTRSFVADKGGNAAQLFFGVKSGQAVADKQLGGLILLSSNQDAAISGAHGSESVSTGYVMMKNPFVITSKNRVFSNSETDVAAEIAKIRAQGYDGFIFDKTLGDNYAVMVFSRKQIVRDITKYAKVRKSVKTDADDFYGENNVVHETELVKHSRKYDDQYMEKAERYNAKSKAVSDSVMDQARKDRARVKSRLAEMESKGVILPADNEKGSKPFSNSSYGGISEENTSICVRSLALEDLVNLVSEATGRPLTVEEQLYISQYVQTVPGMNAPECTYCYVAADRKAYREYLGEYIKQRDAVIEAYKNGETEYSFEGKYGTGLYEKFLNKRKNTDPMQKRFQEWISLVKSGKQLISPADVANLAKLDGDLTEFHKDLIPQIKDAMKYAQAASWAKKRVGFIAYNGHILKWKQSRIDALNSQFGLRMYSFSDFSPAFILENMQMFTDAAAKGLKVLAYTKELAFAKIFAPTGANINVSVFGFEKDGIVAENAMMGAPWDEVKALRAKYKNVGTVFVATSDNLVNWALEQDWIDVVIPYHLVRTGRTIAQIMDYMDYTDESSDTKEMDWKADDGEVSGIYPTMHHNDKETYLAELKKNRLQPRFKRFLDNPNYMKLVNETRQSDLDTEPVQPIFDMEAADVALGQLELEGYYKPIGGTVDRMEQIALGLTEDISSGKAQHWVDQKKSEDKKNFGKVPEIKKSVKELDADYMAAVKSGDMETAQRMVDEAAKKAGYSQKAYHGTNADFYTFDWGETQRADAGFYGRGHYFATRKGEAEMYGRRVIPVALKNSKPFNFDKEMHTVNGVYLRSGPSGNVLSAGISFAINMAEKFPTIFGKKTFTAYDTFDNATTDLKWSDLQKTLDDFLKSTDLRTIQFSDGHYEWFYEKPGHWRSIYTHNNYQSKADAEKDKVGAAIGILFNEVYRISVPLDSAAYFLGGDMDAANAFSEELIKRGYSGVIQAENGDEIVVFDSSNIKDASPVTYDDNGNVIPLSERFNEKKTDIRYSKKDYAAQVETVKNNTHDPNNHVYMGTTPVRLTNILGLPKLPMLTTTNHVYSMAVSDVQANAENRFHSDTNYHNMGWDVVKNLPEYIGEPVMIIKSNKDPNNARFVVITDHTDFAGNPIIAAIKPMGNGKYFGINFDATAMLSSYGKDNFQTYLAKAKNENRILYVDKKRSQTGKHSTGLQLSNTMLSVDFTNSLSQFRDLVNKKFEGTSYANDSGSKKMLFSKKDGVDAVSENTQDNEKRTPFVIPSKAEADRLAAKQAEIDRESERKREARREAVMDEIISSSPLHRERAKQSTKERMQELMDRHGAIPQGENPVREVTVPSKTDKETKVRRTVRTAMEAEITPDSMLPVIEERIIEGSFGYHPQTNAQRMDSARRWVDSRELGSALNEWMRDAGSGKITANLSARGMLLYNAYANAAATESDLKKRTDAEHNAADILATLSRITTVGAQITQFNRMLKKLQPDTQLFALKRNVQAIQDSINQDREKNKKPPITLQLDNEWVDKWVTELRRGPRADQEYLYAIEEKLFADIAKQVPKTFKDKWNAWRYLCMLGNAKTIIRNATGNALFMPAKALKDAIGTGIERIVVKDASKRTKALKGDKDVRAFAERDFESSDVKHLLDSGNGKYSNEGIGTRLDRAIRDAHRNFDAWGLRHWQKATNYLMNDMPYVSDNAIMLHHYKTSLARIAKARGFTAKMLSDGTVSQEMMDEMRAYAVNEALKATYKDVNAISKFMSNLHFKNRIGNTLLEGALPFRATPANVLMRGIEYSPVGFFKSAYDYFYKVKKGEMSTSELLDGISSNLSGAVIFGLGWLLTSFGIIRVGADDDEKREGKQNYSLEIGGFSITLDWVAPASIPFFMGAEMCEILGAENRGGFLDAVISSASRFFAPMLEMSMLSGMQDILDTGSYGGFDFEQMITGFFLQPLFSYIGQGVPTVLSQLANTIEPNRTTTYLGDISGQFTRNCVYMLAKLTEKIPFVDWRQIDYVDTLGRKDENGSWYARVFNNFINPAYVNDINVTDPDAEIRRLESVTGVEISPKKPDSKITVAQYDEFGKELSSDTIVLNADQFEQYSIAYGQQYVLMMTEIMASTFYDTLSDEAKVEAINEVDALAKEYGKIAANVGYQTAPDSGYYKMLCISEDEGIPIAEVYGVNLYKKQLDNDDALESDERKSALINMIGNMSDWSAEQRSAMFAHVLTPTIPDIGGYKATLDEKAQYRLYFGEHSNAVYGELLSNKAYQNADEDTKRAMLDAASELVSFYAKKDWATEYGLKSDSYDPETESNKIDTLIQAGFSFFDAYAIEENVSDLQKWQAIVDNSELSNNDKDKALRGYMDKDTLAKYDTCASAGVTAKEYVSLRTAVSNLKPLSGAKSVSDGQKWQACIKAVSGDKKQDALLRSYMDNGQVAKYDSCHGAGVTAAMYVEYYNAKYVYGDGNGSWTQNELQNWLDSKSLSNKQKSALWTATNSGWKNNPYD